MPGEADRPTHARLRFVSADEEAPPDLLGKGEIWLDVGGDVREGVIDHRHWPGYRGSSARLVLRHPELIEAATGFKQNEEVHLVLRLAPTLDAVTCVYLVTQYLRDGEFGPKAEALVEYIDLLTTGHAGVSQDNLFTPYTAYHTILRRYDEREGSSADRWEAAVQDGLRMLSHCVRQVDTHGLNFGSLDAFKAPKLFGKKDRTWVQDDLGRYRNRLRDPKCRARMETVSLLGRFSEYQRVPGLFIRNVQDSQDEHAVVFFKDWARSDRDNAPEGSNGFEFLTVSGLWSEGQAYSILSIPPESRASLRGLSAILSERESKAHLGPKGRRSRQRNPPDRLVKWSDGYGFSLIRSPLSGTRLSVDEIENAVLEFGRSAPPHAESIPTDPVWDKLEIFISYPRSRLEWVLANVYSPLAQWRGAGRIFLDREALPTGGAWLPRLARGIEASRHFLAVVCPEFFQSEFCMTELTWALMNDIQGNNRKIIPIVIDKIDSLPLFCRHLQFHQITNEHVPAFLRHLFATLLR